MTRRTWTRTKILSVIQNVADMVANATMRKKENRKVHRKAQYIAAQNSNELTTRIFPSCVSCKWFRIRSRSYFSPIKENPTHLSRLDDDFESVDLALHRAQPRRRSRAAVKQRHHSRVACSWSLRKVQSGVASPT